MRRYLAFLSIMAVAMSTGISLPTLPLSHAQNMATVCIADNSSVSCPSTQASFTGPLDRQVQVAVNIQDSARFNKFDISVKTNIGVLDPASVDLTGSLIHDPRFILSECINGRPVIGSCRSVIDGYGIVSLAVAADGYDVPAPATGRLFSITYNMGSFADTEETTAIGFQTGCSNTSNNGFCVTITDGTGLTVPENVQEATFTIRDFSFGMSSAAQSITKGATVTYTLTVASLGDYSETVSFEAVISPGTRRPPSLTISPPSVVLSAGSSSTSILTVTTTRSTTAGIYRITVTASDGVLTRTVCCTMLIVENR